jgi:hypothetical protein
VRIDGLGSELNSPLLRALEAFSSQVETGSRQETRHVKNPEPPFGSTEKGSRVVSA